MSGFYVQEALDDRGTDDATMLAWDRVGQILKDHGNIDGAEFMADTYTGKAPEMVDAGDLFAWLGY